MGQFGGMLFRLSISQLALWPVKGLSFVLFKLLDLIGQSFEWPPKWIGTMLVLPNFAWGDLVESPERAEN